MHAETNVPRVSDYYDTQARRKLADFLEFNPRVEAAWGTILKWAGHPLRILDIGCGVGSLCYRLSERFPDAEVVGVDISPGNLEIAKRVFSGPRISYKQAEAQHPLSLGSFDLILLIDVLEHIEPSQRPLLQRNLSCALRSDGRLVLTFPTPRHLRWLKHNKPSEIQPVDEDIVPELICELAHSLDRDLLLYQDVNIWRNGDYAHAVLGLSGFPGQAEQARKRPWQTWRDRHSRRKVVKAAGFQY